MDTSSLKVLVEDWSKINPSPRHTIAITISPGEEVEVRIYPLFTIKKRLCEFHKKEKCTQHLYTTLTETLHEEFKKRNIDYGSATPQDFLEIFPSKKHFIKIRTIGETAVDIMSLILEEGGLIWPDM